MQSFTSRKRRIPRRSAVILLVMLLVQLMPQCEAWAGNDSPAPLSQTVSGNNPDQNNSSKAALGDISPVVVNVSVDSAPQNNDPLKAQIALRQTIRVTVNNLVEWMEAEKISRDKLMLYIDGIPFRSGQEDNNIEPGLVKDNVLVFDLRRDEQNKEAWTRLLGRNVNNFFDIKRTVPLTVGLESGAQAKFMDVTLVRIDANNLNYFLVFIAVFVVFFFVLAIRSDILRDSGGQPHNGGRKTYSLARTQMALWFVIITVGYIFIWMVTSDIFSLTQGVVGLMGISTVTALGSIAVDSNKYNQLRNQRNEQLEKRLACEREAEKFGSEIASLTLLDAAAPCSESQKALSEKRAALAGKIKEIQQLDNNIQKIDKDIEPKSSKGWYKDLFYDDEGISLHRVQIAVWTLLLVGIFISSVADTLTMPQFDPVLLALMGISGGTYVGFKLPEKQG
ncbi:MAG: hypothetical protein HGB15_06375 [Chlorobaculum sp.]|nr:hypothetical protein [Chlorobaculum sp.]